MVITKAYRTALNPTPRQAARLRHFAAAARYVWNAALDQRATTYDRWKRNDPCAIGKSPKLGWMDQGKELTAVLAMEEFSWLREAPRMALNASLQNLDRAYSAFYRRVKAGQTPGHPKFKSRRGRQGWKFFSLVRVEDGAVYLPKVGRVNLHESGYIPTGTYKILSGAVTWDGFRWHVSVTVEEEVPDPITTGRGLIVHLGLRKLLHLCIVRIDGEVGYDTDDHLHVLDDRLDRLKFLSRRQSRRAKGGARREDAREAVAKLHRHIAMIRGDALHKLSTEIARYRPAYVVIQKWDIAGMLGERKMSRSIADAAWGELTRQITYKAGWAGAQVYIVPSEYPASKRCSHCGSVNEKLKLSEVTWQCGSCGSQHDRERNAMNNLRDWHAKETAPIAVEAA